MQTQSLLEPKSGPAICLATTIARYCMMVELDLVRGGEPTGNVDCLADVHGDYVVLAEEEAS